MDVEEHIRPSLVTISFCHFPYDSLWKEKLMKRFSYCSQLDSNVYVVFLANLTPSLISIAIICFTEFTVTSCVDEVSLTQNLPVDCTPVSLVDLYGLKWRERI